MPKVTVYTPTYNCGKYLEQAIKSVLNQTYQDFELIIVNDGSNDNTLEILQKYLGNSKIKIIQNIKNIGFVRSAIKAINLAKCEYIMRLDADDYLNENALMVMTHILDKHPEFGLVYPDFFHVDKNGRIIDYFRKKEIGKMKLLDLPPNSGGTMIRKSAYKKIGGYRNDIRAQDKYDLWIKFITKFKPQNVYNVNLPLYYYRKHETNISNEIKKIFQTRKYIKRKFIEAKYKGKIPKVLGIIPAKIYSSIYPNFPLKKLDGRSVIYYPIKAMRKTPSIDRVIFTTEDENLAKRARGYGAEIILRPRELTKESVSIEPTVNYVLEYLEKKEKYVPEIIVILFITSPLITSDHIEEAINTLLIYNVDSVISVREDKKFHYRHGKYGLQPLYKKRLLKYEKDLLFEETGSLIVSKREFISQDNILGVKISHILLADDEAIDIDNKFHFWLAEQILREMKNLN